MVSQGNYSSTNLVSINEQTNSVRHLVGNEQMRTKKAQAHGHHNVKI
jgi:hypothetical protein